MTHQDPTMGAALARRSGQGNGLRAAGLLALALAGTVALTACGSTVGSVKVDPAGTTVSASNPDGSSAGVTVGSDGSVSVNGKSGDSTASVTAGSTGTAVGGSGGSQGGANSGGSQGGGAAGGAQAPTTVTVDGRSMKVAPGLTFPPGAKIASATVDPSSGGQVTLSAPDSSTIAAFYRGALPAAGYTIANDAGGLIQFQGHGWTGTITAVPGMPGGMVAFTNSGS